MPFTKLLITAPLALLGLAACGSDEPAFVVGFNARDEVVIFAGDDEVPTVFERSDLDAAEVTQVQERPEFDSRADSDAFVVALGD